VVSWLQEIARNNFSFRKNINFDYALTKNDLLVSEYLNYREKHFGIIKRQYIQLIAFKIVITAGLLLIGGYLVLNQQMNIGQFVAAEIIILLVINSVEKIIIGLETLYDVLTAVEKIGQITDLKIENTTDVPNEICYSNITLEVEKLNYKFQDSNNFVLNTINFKLEPSEKIIIKGNNGSGKTTLIRILSGLLQPTSGTFFINDDTYRKINLDQYRSQISVIISGETPFEGTILENITFNNPNISQEDLKWAIDSVQLGEYIKSLPKGLDTKIYPEGKQLSSSNAQKILLARSIITKPKILFLEEPFDKMDDITANELIDFITDSNQKWALVITSKNPYWEKKCTRIIIMQEGEIYNDLKK
jgi:ABC-type bacteriocin/lantibiotic exporter with double-glycine peptidase domain